MGFLDSIKSMLGGGPAAGSARETDRTIVVDAEKMADSREGRTGPVERVQALQQLSRFAEREKIEIIAVLNGRPLREVAHGEAFNKIRVFYAEASGTVADQLEKVASDVRGPKMVVTNDKQLETRLAQRGIPTLRVSTLRKAFEGGGEGGGGDGGRGRDRRSNRRGPRSDRHRQGAENGGATESAAPQAPESSSSEPGDTVDGLIDRVN